MKVNMLTEQSFYFQKLLLWCGSAESPSAPDLIAVSNMESSIQSKETVKRWQMGQQISTSLQIPTKNITVFATLNTDASQIQNSKYAKMFIDTSVCILFKNAAGIKNLIVRTKP